MERNKVIENRVLKLDSLSRNFNFIFSNYFIYIIEYILFVV